MNPLEKSNPAAIRQKGLHRLLIGLVVFAAGMTVPLFVLPRFGHQLTPVGMVPFALPGAYALAGLVELVTGVSFFEFARRWDELKGWQRGVFGTIIVLIAGFLILCGFAIFASNL